MPEWWTYTLSDLQSFSLETYYRLFARYNTGVWPGPLVAAATGTAIGLFLRRRGDGRRARLVTGILAACWLWTAIAFHATHYATIHRAAVYFAWAFGLEALLLVAAGVFPGRFTLERRGAARWLGLSLFVFALLLQPLVGLLFGREWREVEIFGIAPDPTSVGTLGILLLTVARRRWVLMAVPLLWCAFSGATLLALGSPAGWLVITAAAVALVGSGLKS